ncbi:unnamed protein product [Brugia timori]|uniref:Ovule protein n=1 Tax=Brugia timori TaxID=42155 RepID=A0A0R3RAJ8_9BILA|nr:unnamed protein product [Brugia timori]
MFDKMGVYFLSYVTNYSNIRVLHVSISKSVAAIRKLCNKTSHNASMREQNENEISEKRSKANSRLTKRFCKDIIKVRIP